MTLGKRIILQNALLFTSLLVFAAFSIWCLSTLVHIVNGSSEEFDELKSIDEIHALISNEITRLEYGRGDFAECRAELEPAIRKIREFITIQQDIDPGESEQDRQEIATATESLKFLESAIAILKDSPGPPDSSAVKGATGALRKSLVALFETRPIMTGYLSELHFDAVRRARTMLWIIGLLFVVTLISALLLGISQYRGIIVPLRALQEGVKSVTKGRFEQRLDAAGPVEFIELAEDFNRMAEELNGLYRSLEARVASKSKELARSERLASVGFLAAGVAHEINGPLNIISGYAELSLKEARQGGEANFHADAKRTLSIIRDEAFRCKDITDKLLSLTRASAARGVIDLAVISKGVVVLVHGLLAYQDRNVSLRLEAADSFTVRGNDNELKQILLNLVTNALEAVSPVNGRIEIGLDRHGDTIELSVTDNGRGIAAEALERVFEPFYSETRRNEEVVDGEATRRGVGLGLSISLAIAESLGGRITATSAGPNLGSRFVVHLPAAPLEAIP